MLKKFNLIELVIVIAIIAIISSIVINNTKDVVGQTDIVAIKSNINSLQTATDSYILQNHGMLPSIGDVTQFIPAPLDLKALPPNFLNNLPKQNNIKYWVDYRGTVWASTIDSPTEVDYSEGIVTWNTVEGAISYRVFEVSNFDTNGASIGNKKVNMVAEFSANEVGDSPSFIGNPDKYYLINATDRFDLDTAPVGKGYTGYLGIDGDFPNNVIPEEETPPVLNNKPVPVISMTPELFITTDSIIQWSFENSYDPDGDTIINVEWDNAKDNYPLEGLYKVELRVQDEHGLWSDWVKVELDVINSDTIKTVASGSLHTFIIKNDNSLWTFGNNYYGQLGYSTNSYTNNPNPYPYQVMSGVKQITAGEYHSIIVKNTGSAWAFGYNRYGQLGIEYTAGYSTANYNPEYVMESVREVEAGSNHTLFIKNDNTLWASGNKHFAQYGHSEENCSHGNQAVAPPILIMENVKTVSAGEDFTLFIKTDNSLWSVGNNKYGQLGISDSSGSSSTVENPEKVMDGVKDIEAGGQHSLVLKLDNTLWTFGRNREGQIGISKNYGKNKDNYIPTQLMSNIKDMAAGYQHSIILKSDNSLWGFGDNGYGQLGTDKVLNNTNNPTEIKTY